MFARILRFRFSLAQLLILTLMVSVILSCTVALRRIWAFRFPEFPQDVQISADGALVGLVLRGSGRFCCVVCDAESGTAFRWAEFGGEPASLELSRDLTTWAALFADGRIESGSVGSARGCPAKPSPEFAPLLKPPAGSSWREQPDCPDIALSGNGMVLAVSRSNQIAVFDTVTGAQTCLVTIPRETAGLYALLGSPDKVLCFCLSDDGSRLAASYYRCRPAVSPLPAIAMWNAENGHLIGPPCFPDIMGSLRAAAWLGNDAVAAVRHRVVGARSWGIGHQGVLVVSVDGRQTVKEDFKPVPGRGTAAAGKQEWLEVQPLLAASTDGKTIVVPSSHFGGLLVLNAATLDVRYSIADPRCDPQQCLGLAISRDGARVAVISDDFNHPAGSHVSVVDMRSGEQHEIRPHRNNVPRSAALLIPAGFLLAGCTWLMWRTAPRRPATESQSAET